MPIGVKFFTMPIDLSKLTPRPAQTTSGIALRPASRTSALQQMPLIAGEMVQASISKVAAVSAQQLQSLERLSLEQPLERQATKEQGSSNAENSLPKASTNKTDITSRQYQALLARPSLYLIQVQIKTQVFTLISDQQLHKGQKITLALDENSHLVLLNKNPKPVASQSVINTNSTSSQIAQASAPKPLLQQILRELLPLHDKPGITENSKMLEHTLQKMPLSDTTKKVVELLQKVQSLTLPVDKTPSLAQVKESLLQSGSLLEARLEKFNPVFEKLSSMKKNPLISTTKQTFDLNHKISQTLSTDIKSLLLQLVKATQFGVIAKENHTATSILNAHTPESIIKPETNNSNVKNIALDITINNPPTKTLSKQTTATLKQSTAMSFGGLPLTPKTTPDPISIPPPLLQIFGHYGHKIQASVDARTLQTQLILLVHQLSLSNLAKVRINQLQPDAHHKAQADGGAQSLSFDIPVRHDGALHNAHIQIFQDDENTQAKAKKIKSTKCWQVRLHICTDVIGDFYIHLALLNEKLSIKFWSHSTRTLHEAKQKFSKIKVGLESQGIDVDKVQYRQGAPEAPSNALHYSLVDIKT